MKPINVLIVDFSAAVRILRKCATAQVVAQNVKHSFRAIEVIATVNWSEIGIWEREMPDWKVLRSNIQYATTDRVTHMLRVAQQGPTALNDWFDWQQRDCDKNLQHYFEAVAGYAKINDDVIYKLDTSVKLAKAARFWGSVGLCAAGTVATVGALAAVGTAGAAAAAKVSLAGAATGFVKSVSFAVIKEWNNAKTAKVVAIAVETAKAGVNEGLGSKGSDLLECASKSSFDDAVIAGGVRREAGKITAARVADAEARLVRLQRQVIGGQSVKGAKQQAVKIAGQRAAVVAERGAATAAAVAKAARAQMLRRAGMALAGGAVAVFSVWDTYDAIQELGE